MAVSAAEACEVRCPQCGGACREVVWRVIDLGERPDLGSVLAGDGWWRLTCPVCGGAIERDRSALVLRLSRAAPLVLGLPYKALAGEDPFGPEGELIERTQAALGPEGADVAGPVLLAPFDVVQVSAARGLDEDAREPARAVEDVRAVDPAVAEDYGVFLGMVRDSAGERRVNLAMNTLVSIDSEESMRAAFADFPELAEDAVRDRLMEAVESAGDDEAAHVARMRLALVDTASGGDYSAAWAQYEQGLLELANEHVGPRMKALYDRLVEAADDPEAAASIGEALLELMTDFERPEFEAEICQRTASALFLASGPEREERLERAIRLGERAVELLAGSTDPSADALRAQAMLNLGAGYASRLRADPAANQDRAIELQGAVLDLVSLETDGRMWAMAHANIGLSLIERASLRGEGEADARDAEMDRAIAHLNYSLRWRSFERDPLDWAYTETALGVAYGRMRGTDRRRNLERAIEHHSEASRGFREANESALEAQALHNLAAEQRTLAELEGTEASERAALLHDAGAHARRSLELRPVDLAPVDAGRTLVQLGEILEASDETAAAASAYSDALQVLTPDDAPRECRRVARRLAEAATELGDLELAADAWDVAAQGAAAAVESRAGSEGRFAELRENLNLFRFAAYMLARAGRPARAVEVLELGRARELALWLQRDAIDLKALESVDPALYERFLHLRSQREAAERHRRAGRPPASAETAGLAEAYRETLREIRTLPGLHGFLKQPAFEEIAAAIPEGEALAYLVTAPAGSVVLIVRSSQLGDRPEVIETPLTSTEALNALLWQDPDSGEVRGYLIALEGGDDLDETIEKAASVIAPALLRPLAERLAGGSVSTLCLIPIGLLGRLPLHALEWETPEERQALVDGFDVAVVPSAFARTICRRRAENRTGAVRLLAVGNPLPHPKPLAGAEWEAQMVARTLPSAASHVLIGSDATKLAVVGHLPWATHAHLACHGIAAMSAEELDSGLSLGNAEALSATEIVDINISARLVVASACDSGDNPGYEEADEVLSLGTVFLGAGAAGVVASLWPVSDAATALLMSRFYEAIADGRSPAASLRTAQLWLRRLTRPEAEAYVESRPALRQYDVTRRPATTRAPGERDPLFAAPSLWAAFVFTGA
jgi:CHAT domain-containing protein